MITKDKSLRKVVVRTRGGEVIPGFANKELIKNSLEIISNKGQERTFRLESLKAVYFVKDFAGNPEYNEIKFLTEEPTGSMLWVRLKFYDGEVQEGKVPNDLELFCAPGFFLWPLDRDTNNECVYVIKSSLKSLSILQLA